MSAAETEAPTTTTFYFFGESISMVGHEGRIGRQKVGQKTYLPLIQVPPPEMFTMQYTPRPHLLKLLQALYLRNPGHPIMATSHHHGIEPLRPPVILLLSFLAEGNFPLVADLLHPLDSRVIRHQILVPVPVYQAFNIPPYGFPVAERRVGTVHVDGKLTLFWWKRFLAELHGNGVDVGFQVRVDGGFGEARLVQLGG